MLYNRLFFYCHFLVKEEFMLKTKIFGFVLMLGLAAVLGACEPGTEPETPPATPTPGEPTDGATPAPAPGTNPQ
jgi:hypothetical protein